jgi:hypothetical protein
MYADVISPTGSAMKVRLRIAGLYYDEKFDFAELSTIVVPVLPGRPIPAGPTILELMEAAFSRPGRNKEDFNYTFERRGERGLSMVSLGVTHRRPLVGTLGGNSRPAGRYELAEIAIPHGIVAWQYYVYKAGVSKSQLDYEPTDPTGYSPAKPPKGDKSGFTAFDQFPLEDGDEVIWRQVAILREPVRGAVALS